MNGLNLKMEHIMKIPVFPKNERGMALVISLMFLALLSMLGTTAYVMTTTDLNIGTNYQASSASFYDAEAGVNFTKARIIEGLVADPPTFPSGGTTLEAMNVGDAATLSYTTPTGFFFTISNLEKVGSDLYSFTSTGRDTPGANGSEVVIEVKLAPIKPTIFNYGVFGDESVTLRGQGYTDSYNSDNAPWTTEGEYTEGDVGTNAAGSGAITVSGSNAQVYGDAQIGPGGDTSTGITTHSTGQISGDKDVASEEKDMTCMTDSYSGAYSTVLASLTSGTQSFSTGSYGLTSIGLSSHAVCEITGDVIFYVQGDISLSAHAQLVIAAGASLKIYASGNIYLAGQCELNTAGYPESLQIYGTSTCTDINLAGQEAFYGAIYAPEADIKLSGQGDVFGAICGNTIDLSGQGSVHYDEALNDIEGDHITDMETVSWERRY